VSWELRANRPLVIKGIVFCFWMTIINLGVHVWKSGLEKSRRENLLQMARSDGHQTESPRFDLSTGENPEEYLRYIPESTSQKIVVLCGMSQMYAINDEKSSDQTISEWMDDFLRPEGSRVFGLAAPNLCNEEAVLLLLASISDKDRRASAFIYGLCFDKFRNIDLRPGYQRLLCQRPDLRTSWMDIAKRYRAEFPLAANKMETTLKKASEEAEQTEKSFEYELRTALSRTVPIIQNRRELNAWFQLQLYSLRNKIFNIQANSKRPQIKSRYLLNRQFLELMIAVAKRAGAVPIFYIVPLNPLAENPYISSEYEEFKSWVEELAKTHQVPYANLEDIVPKEEWGEFMGGPDYKHFRGAAHCLTAEELVRRFHLYLVKQ
jgi:hypothetical protein